MSENREQNKENLDWKRKVELVRQLEKELGIVRPKTKY
jgi:hypothetical protein